MLFSFFPSLLMETFLTLNEKQCFWNRECNIVISQNVTPPPQVSAHYNFIFAYFTSSMCSLHARVIFIKGNDNFNVTFWKKTAFQWLFYSRPSNFTSFLVEGTRTFLERPFSLFWVTFLLTCYRLYFFSRGR